MVILSQWQIVCILFSNVKGPLMMFTPLAFYFHNMTSWHYLLTSRKSVNQ